VKKARRFGTRAGKMQRHSAIVRFPYVPIRTYINTYYGTHAKMQGKRRASGSFSLARSFALPSFVLSQDVVVVVV